VRRLRCSPRPDWRERIRETGLTFGEDYWEESAYYEFTARDIDIIEQATNELHQMCLDVVDRIIEAGDYSHFTVPEWVIPMIEASWAGDGHPSIYSRFDLAYDGVRPPKMLEYNADTPTSLLETAATQWHWLEESRPDLDQFNSIHENLVEQWRYLSPYLYPGLVHFACLADISEDDMTVAYMREVASQAGLSTSALDIRDMGWHGSEKRFVDQRGVPIRNLFKLYPWEWLVAEPAAAHINDSWNKMFWIEPAWKLLLSNKAILAALWQSFPGHPNLLPASLERSVDVDYVTKPRLSREGANVTIVSSQAGTITGHDSGYGKEGHVYQQYFHLPEHDGRFAVVGSWVVGGEACGMGIRESASRITDNRSFFVPHVIRD
jgi:glutathionylspermidine synthase